MNQKLVVVLAVIVLLMAALAALLSMDQAPTDASARLIPGLSEKLSAVDRVQIVSKDGAVTLSMSDGRWGVEEKGGYPVELKQLSEMVNQLAQAKLIEKKTARVENYARLGVTDLEDPDSSATQINVGAGDAQFSILLGNRSDGRQGRFARIEAQVWLTDEIAVQSDATEWLEPIVIDIEAEDVSRVTLQSEGSELVFERDEAGDFKGPALPDGRELKYPSIVSEPARALAKLRLDDVAAHDPARWADASRALFTLKDDTEISVMAVQKGEGNWLRLSVSGPRASDHAGLTDWDYQVAAYVYDDFVKTLDDLMAEEKQPSAQEAD